MDPSDDFDTALGIDLFDPDITLEQAVNLKGGGVKKVARHLTAALLNLEHPDVDYPFADLAAILAANINDVVDANELLASGFCE